MFKLQKIKDTKLTLLVPIIMLCIIGAITVFSTTYSKSTGASSLFTNHILFYIVGFLIFFGLSAFNPSKLKNKLIIILLIIFSIASLIAVIFLGTEIYGAQRWIDLGIFSFQPSEFVKISIILVTSFCLGVTTKKSTEEIFDIYKISTKNFIGLRKLLTSQAFIKTVIAYSFYIISVFLIIKQKSLGNSILVTLIFLTIVFLNMNIRPSSLVVVIPLVLGVLISFNVPDLGNLNALLGINFRFNLVAITVVIVGIYFISRKFKLNIILLLLFFTAGLAVQPATNFLYNNVLEAYQRQRVESFLGNQQSANIFLNEDFNRQMSILAVGSGRVFGKGLLNGNIVNSRLLPFAYTDFAYAGFAEQFGFAGGLLIILLYLVLIIKIFRIYLNTEDKFYKLICMGVISLIFFNCAQHIAMNMGITPITGVPLPLISYGGSSILSIFIGLGIVNSIELFGNNEVEIENLKSEYGF